MLPFLLSLIPFPLYPFNCMPLLPRVSASVLAMVELGEFWRHLMC